MAFIIFLNAISQPYSFMDLMPYITSWVIFTLLSLNPLISFSSYPFFFEIRKLKGVNDNKRTTEINPNQPIKE